MDWECGQLNVTTVLETSTCNWLVAPSVLRDKYTDPTLMSTMVWLEASPGANPQAGSIVGFGIIVVTAFNDADPLGVNCPDPIEDCDADWVYLWYKPYVFGGTIPFDQNAGSELDRRSQAKRRLGNDKAILLVASSIGQGINIHAHVRCLIKE